MINNNIINLNKNNPIKDFNYYKGKIPAVRYDEGSYLRKKPESFPEVLERLGLLGSKIRITSGHRKPGEAGNAGTRSNHTKLNKFGLPYAYDIVPVGMSFTDLDNLIKENAELLLYLLNNNYRIIREDTADAIAKYGSTGRHWHLSYRPGSTEGTAFRDYVSEYYGNKEDLQNINVVNDLEDTEIPLLGLGTTELLHTSMADNIGLDSSSEDYSNGRPAVILAPIEDTQISSTKKVPQEKFMDRYMKILSGVDLYINKYIPEYIDENTIRNYEYNSTIPSSNSVKPNLFYDGGDTMTSQFLDQVLADREANLLRNEELAALYNFSPLAISDILLGKDVNVYTPDVVVTGKAPSVGFYPYGYRTVDKFYLDNPSGLMEDIGSFVPFVGDGMEVSNIANDLRLDNYGLAGLGLSLLALPNIIEKPLKFLAKNGYKIAGRAANMIKDELTPLYYNYKYGKKATKDMYDDFIHGKSYPAIMGIGKLDIRPLGMKSLQELMRDVVDRNSEIYKSVGVPEETINKYRELAKNIMGNIRVGRYTDTQYKTAGRKSAGFHAVSVDPFFISINRYSRMAPSKTILHETRHALDYLLDHTSQYSPTAYGARKLDRAKYILESFLNNAYDLDFIDLPNTKYAGSLAGYPLMNVEKITTNLDSRNELLKLLTNTGSLDINNLRAVNLAIDAASDDEIFLAVFKSNGYGSRYIKFLKDNNKLTPEKAQQFREAMKYVGASAAPVGIWATTATSLDNKQHAFGGSLNKFSGEEDNYTQYMNTPNIFRKKDGTYVYLSSPTSDEISVEPINTVFEDPALWTYRDEQGRLYTPRSMGNNNLGTITLKEDGPIMSAVNNYLRELLYKWDNNIPIDGKYTMPAIAAAAAMPLLGEAAYPVLTNPYVDAGITSAFGAHGLNKLFKGEINSPLDGAMTALEVTPLWRLAKPIYSTASNLSKPIIDKSKWLYNKGNIFNTSMKYNPNNFYREVSKEAIDDAIKSGVVRTGNSDHYIGPFFAKGDTPWHREKYIIEGYPEKNDWIYAIPYENAFWVGKEEASVGKTLMQQALNYKVTTNTPVGVEVFPYTNGSINATPTSNFSYWKNYPIIGWRKNSFKNIEGTPQITLKNATSITPKLWTTAQDAAIARGNMREAQRLRDLHFMIASPNNKAINSKGTPLLSYHTVDDKYNPNFTAFNPEIEGTHSSIYTTDNPFMSGSYTTKITSELERNNIIEVTRQREINRYNKLLEHAQNRKATNAYEKSIKEDDIKFANKWLKIYSDPKKGKKLVLSDHQWVSMPTENKRMKRLYINLENPIVIDNYGRSWNNMPLHQLPEDVYNLIKPDIRGNLLNASYTTRSLEKAQRAANRYDGSIIKNVVDYGGQKQYGFEEPGTVFQINNPNNIKLEDAVTYDDNGIRIPLGERDNFNINDIRYGLVFPVATGLGLSLYNLGNQMLHSLGGPLKKFEEGK